MGIDTIPLSVNSDTSSGLWGLTAPGGSLGQPVVGPEAVYLLVADRMASLNRHDGQVRWQRPHGVFLGRYPLSAKFTAVGRYLVVPGADTDDGRTVTVLDAATGERVWSREAEPIEGHRADEQTLVLWSKDKYGPSLITALDLADGHQLWQRKFEEIDQVLLTGGRVLAEVKSRTGRGSRGYDARTGERLWEGDCWTRVIHEADASVVFNWSWPSTRLQWFDPATGETLGSCHPRVKEEPYGALFTDGGDTLWLAAHGKRRVYRLRPFESPKPTHSFRTGLRGLAWSEDRIAVVDGWLYGLDEGNRVLCAPVEAGGRLKQLSWPADTPRRERRSRYRPRLVPGPNHLYATWEQSGRSDAVLGIRHGRVLWSLPIDCDAPVPAGDRVLIGESTSKHDRLWLVDGETGAFTGRGPRLADR
jgi:outer membrane protein assembly factor BamB